MKKHILHALWTAVFCLLLLNGSVYGEGDSTRSNTDEFILKSAIVNDGYRVEVALPPGYDGDPDLRYQTVYVLDGNWNADNARRIMDKLVSQGEIAPLIVVSVCPVQALQSGYTGTGFIRCRDLTPTQVKKYPGSGSASQFGEMIKTELIPAIDGRYRTIPGAEGRCLVGHSFGGLFAYYMLFNYRDTFAKFMAFSPSLWWDGRYMMKYEEDYAKSHSELNARLYTTVGGREFFMRGNQRRFVRQLESRRYSGFSFSSEVIKGAKHVTNWNPSFERGLRLFFGE